jgi:hypothetical protein
MLDKPLEDVTEQDLLGLIDAGVGESRTVEYKRELPASDNQGKVGVLRSISGFANTLGGHLIYGMEATDGMPKSLAPLQMSSLDQSLQWIGNLLTNGVEPRIPDVRIQPIALASGGQVLVIRVGKSWNSPHRVTLGGHSHFYGRNAAGVYPLEVSELRQAFTLSSATTERIRAFIADRLFALDSGRGPVPLIDGALSVLHVVPLQSFLTDLRIDIASRSSSINQIHPLGGSGYNHRLNLDGRLAYRSESNGRSYGYAQLFRNGIIETVDVQYSVTDEDVIASMAYERDILQALASYAPALNDLGVKTPAFVFYSMIGVKGYQLAVDRSRLRSSQQPADRDALSIPEVVISDWGQDMATLMQPVFDTVWNAFGFPRSYNYDESGIWVGQ